MSKKKSEPKAAEKVEEYDVWQCQACEGKPEMERTQVKDHLQTVHDVTEEHGIQRMIKHLDGQEWFGGTTSWTIGGIEIVNFYRYERAEDDMMRWA